MIKLMYNVQETLLSQGRLVLTVLLVPLFFTQGCVKKRSPMPVVEEVQELYAHTVKFEGETVGIIARWYTGKASNWSLITAANPELDPTAIQLGQIIEIPYEALVRQEPLPESAVRRVYEAVGEEDGGESAGESTEVAQEETSEQSEADSMASTMSSEVEINNTVAEQTAVVEQIQQPEMVAREEAPRPTSGGGSRFKSQEELLRELLAE